MITGAHIYPLKSPQKIDSSKSKVKKKTQKSNPHIQSP